MSQCFYHRDREAMTICVKCDRPICKADLHVRNGPYDLIDNATLYRIKERYGDSRDFCTICQNGMEARFKGNFGLGVFRFLVGLVIFILFFPLVDTFYTAIDSGIWDLTFLANLIASGGPFLFLILVRWRLGRMDDPAKPYKDKIQEFISSLDPVVHKEMKKKGPLGKLREFRENLTK